MPDIEPNPESTASMDEPADVTASLPATTMAFPQVEDAADEPTEDQPLPPPSIGDVGATFVDWLRGRAQAARSFAATHKWTFALAALCAVAAIAADDRNGVVTCPAAALIRTGRLLSSSRFNSLCSSDFANAFSGQISTVFDINGALNELFGSFGSSLQGVGEGLSGLSFGMF